MENLVDERAESRVFRGKTAKKVFCWQPELPAWKRQVRAIVDQAWHQEKDLIIQDVYDKVKDFLPKDETQGWSHFLLHEAREAGIRVLEVLHPPIRIESGSGEKKTG